MQKGTYVAMVITMMDVFLQSEPGVWKFDPNKWSLRSLLRAGRLNVPIIEDNCVDCELSINKSELLLPAATTVLW